MSYQYVNVLVTDADGFMGSHFNDALVHVGANVTALSLRNSFESHGWLNDLSDETRRELTLVRSHIRYPAFATTVVAPVIELGRPYNAGRGKAVYVVDLIDLILAATGCNKPIVQDSQRFRPVNSEVLAVRTNFGRLGLATGRQPRASLREGLERTIAWWRRRRDEGLVRRKKGFIT